MYIHVYTEISNGACTAQLCDIQNSKSHKRKGEKGKKGVYA